MTAADFEMLPVLTLGELARISGLERRRLRRQLMADKVPLRLRGNRWEVSRVALRRSCPDLYEGLIEKLTIEQ